MKNLWVLLIVLVSFSSAAFSSELCGRLDGYCGNGWCVKTITSFRCPDGENICEGGISVDVVPDNDRANQELNELLERGQGTYVCVEGEMDGAGVFHVLSARAE